MPGVSEGLALFAIIVILFAYIEIQQLKAELRRQSEELDSIRAKLGIIEPSTVAPEIRRLLQEGRKIEAIKVYREMTGVGLAEAKAAVERIRAGAEPDADVIFAR